MGLMRGVERLWVACVAVVALGMLIRLAAAHLGPEMAARGRGHHRQRGKGNLKQAGWLDGGREGNREAVRRCYGHTSATPLHLHHLPNGTYDNDYRCCARAADIKDGAACLWTLLCLVSRGAQQHTVSLQGYSTHSVID